MGDARPTHMASEARQPDWAQSSSAQHVLRTALPLPPPSHPAIPSPSPGNSVAHLLLQPQLALSLQSTPWYRIMKESKL